MSDEYTRRRILQGTAGGITIGAATHGVTAQQEPRNEPEVSEESPQPAEGMIVGTASQAATDRAKSLAGTVIAVHEFGQFGQAVVGEYPDTALAELEQRSDIRYIEPNGLIGIILLDRKIRLAGISVWFK